MPAGSTPDSISFTSNSFQFCTAENRNKKQQNDSEKKLDLENYPEVQRINNVFHIVNKVEIVLENVCKTHTFSTLLTMWNTSFMRCTPELTNSQRNSLTIAMNI